MANVNIGMINKDMRFLFLAGFATFATYCCMYAFRKPFTAVAYNGLTFCGFDYKTSIVLLQLMGYTLSKFVGIRVISALNYSHRSLLLVILLSITWMSLLLFAIVPTPFNGLLMFINGIPLGMVWGVVFSFIEGRRQTELLGAIMASSFSVSSGFVKATGLYLINFFGISLFWMPFATATLFIPPLAFSILLLNKIPAPDDQDIALRSKRDSMSRATRKQFIVSFLPGIVLSVLIYAALTLFRDLRDNFMADLLKSFGYTSAPWLLIVTELPVAFFVLLLVGLGIMIRQNQNALFVSIKVILLSGVAITVTTFIFAFHLMNPLFWLILVGFLVYLPYIIFHTFLFERWLAVFKNAGNVGFLMYLADSTGYLASIGILLFKNMGASTVMWQPFFIITGIVIGLISFFCGLLMLFYFRNKTVDIFNKTKQLA